MKNSVLSRFALLSMMLVVMTASIYAAGTPAGTPITNIAKMVWEDPGGVKDSLFAQSDTVFVEKVDGVDLTPETQLQAVSDSMKVHYPMTFTNTGNDTGSFKLTITDQNSWSPKLFLDANGNSILDGGETEITELTAVKADSLKYLIAEVFVPPGTNSGVSDTLTVIATSYHKDPGTNAQAGDTVIAAALTRVAKVVPSKSSTGDSPEPGQTINYSISFTNTGTGQANSPTVYDTLSTYVTLNYASLSVISGGGSADTIHTAPGVGEKVVVRWTPNDIIGGGTGSMSFTVTVNDSIPSGSIIDNIAYVSYTDSISGHPKKPGYKDPTPPTVSATTGWQLRVEVAGGSAWTLKTKEDSANVSTQVLYKIRLKNTGNGTDSVTFTRSSSFPLTWTLFRDLNGNGSLDGGDIEFAPGDTLSGVAQNGFAYFIVRDTIPAGTVDRSMDTAKYLFKSIIGSSKDSGYTITRMRAPVMSITKSVSSTGNRSRPGDTLVYTISFTNSGSAPANSVIITDQLTGLAYYDYLAGSMQIDTVGTGISWNPLGDGAADTDLANYGVAADYNVTSANIITADLGTVGPGYLGDFTSIGKIRFKVRIKSN